MKEYNIAVLPGDGIGPEIMKEAIKVLKVCEELTNKKLFNFTTFDWNCNYYLKHGKMMPDDGLETLKNYDAILFGAVGSPNVPDHISVWELILPIRRKFNQYVNLRPIKKIAGVTGGISSTGDIDFLIVRENTEGEYSQIGGRMHEGTPYEIAIQNNVFSKYGTNRIMEYGYKLAAERNAQEVVISTKSNAISYAMPFWEEVAKEVNQKYSQIETKFEHVDALAAKFVSSPESYNVVICTNLFGDILSDLGAAIVGSLGIAPSANINPEKEFPSMFEPIHGSAPDIAGQGIANPIGQILSAAMMLDHLGEYELSEKINAAVEKLMEENKILTPDLNGNATTEEVGEAIKEILTN